MKLSLLMGGLALLQAPDGFDRLVTSMAKGRQASEASIVAALRSASARDLDSDERAKTPEQQAPRYRDRALGPGYRAVMLQPGARLQLQQTFFAGQMARVAAVAATPITFQLSVRSEEGAQDCARSARAIRCAWVPFYTSRYDIELSNHGPQPARFYIVLQ